MKLFENFSFKTFSIVLTVLSILVLILAVVIENPQSTRWSENGPLTQTVMVLFPLVLGMMLFFAIKGLLKK